MVMTTPAQGALTQLYAATSLEVEEKNLKYARAPVPSMITLT